MQGVLLAYFAKRLIHTSAAVLKSSTRISKHVVGVWAVLKQPQSYTDTHLLAFAKAESRNVVQTAHRC